MLDAHISFRLLNEWNKKDETHDQIKRELNRRAEKRNGSNEQEIFEQFSGFMPLWNIDIAIQSEAMFGSLTSLFYNWTSNNRNCEIKWNKWRRRREEEEEDEEYEKNKKQ